MEKTKIRDAVFDIFHCLFFKSWFEDYQYYTEILTTDDIGEKYEVILIE